MRVILATDTGIHGDYVGLCVAAWRKFVPECSISLAIVHRSDEGRLDDGRIDVSGVDGVEHFAPIDGIATSANAKLARLWLAASAGSETVTLEDVDLILTQSAWHRNKLSQYQHGRMMLMGREVYAAIGQQVRDRAPISKMTCEGDTLMDVINPLGISTYDKWVLSWVGTDRYGHDNVQHGEFSDEVFLCSRIEDYNKPDVVQCIERGFNVWVHSLDRAAWHLLDLRKLWTGWYIESHALKPYRENLVMVNPIHSRRCGWPRNLVGMLPIIRYIGYDEPEVRGI